MKEEDRGLMKIFVSNAIWELLYSVLQDNLSCLKFGRTGVVFPLMHNHIWFQFYVLRTCMWVEGLRVYNRKLHHM